MIEFSCQDEQNLYINLKGLCNKNDGLFKSAKQAQFLFSTYSKRFDSTWTKEQFATNFGVTVGKDQSAVVLTAHMRWADYGTRSIVPVLHIFVLDQAGVVEHYKVGGKGNLRDGWAPDPSKAGKQWTRPDGINVPDYTAKEQDPPVRPSNWIGAIGEKVSIDAKIIRTRDLGFGRFGAMFITVLEDNNGNVINVWRNLGPVGQNLKLSGTVKECGEYKEVKQTTLTRVFVNQQ